ncbi:MAG: hypothetical protein HQL29_04505 [Candidatus Omnitrophica bacterium]|nr:hypothetical protein [Candidatus Omnitrophota bacterium]
MGIIDIVKKGFGSASKLLNIVVIFFIFNAIVGILSLPLTDPANTANPAIVSASVIVSILFFLGFIFLQGGALGMVKDHLKTGSSDIGSFVGYGKKFYLRILGLLALYILVAIGVVLVLALLSSGLLLLGDNVVVRSLVAILVTIVSVGLITVLIFPVYAIITDDAGSVASLKKGMVVAKENFVKTLSVFIVMLVISLVISAIVGFLAGLITIPLGDVLGRVVLTIVNAAVQSYIPVVMMIVFMSLYMSLEDKKA